MLKQMWLCHTLVTHHDPSARDGRSKVHSLAGASSRPLPGMHSMLTLLGSRGWHYRQQPTKHNPHQKQDNQQQQSTAGSRALQIHMPASTAR